MKLFLCVPIVLLSCDFSNPKPAKGGDDNSHLRNPEQGINLTRPDSINIEGNYFYKLTNDLRINNQFVLDSFILDKSIDRIGKPDSIHRGGPEIIAEFGADDYDLFFGKSIISAGHGQLLMIKINDESLRINSLKIGSNRRQLNEQLHFDFPKKDTVMCLGIGDDVYYFIFDEQESIRSIEYWAPPL